MESSNNQNNYCSSAEYANRKSGQDNNLVPASETSVARIANLSCGDGRPLLIIAGPCVIETETLTLTIAEKLKDISSRLGLPFIFKASYDKANRTSDSTYRGPGLKEGLRILEKVRRDLNVPVVTDIHESYQAFEAAAVVDLLQIPAFLARQTDLLKAAAATGKPVHVKKGQFMAPSDMKNVVEKLNQFGCKDVLVCERGTFFGYGRLVNDMTALVEMRDLGVPVVFDATHSVQQPGGLGTATGGNRRMIAPLARAAVAVGIDGLFFETHPNPDCALCDGPNSLQLSQVESFLEQLLQIREACRE